MTWLWVLVPLLAFLDRLAGGWPQVPGRGVWYGTAALAAVLFALHQPLWLALVFFIWRDAPPKIFGGELDKPSVGTFLRHCIVLLMAFFVPNPWWLLAFPVFATAIAPGAARYNTFVELGRGTFLGGLLCLSLLQN